MLMKKDYKYLDIAYSPLYIYINLYNLTNILHSTCLFYLLLYSAYRVAMRFLK